MIPVAEGGWIWWRSPTFRRVQFCKKCRCLVSKWHRHYPLDKDDPQYRPPRP